MLSRTADPLTLDDLQQLDPAKNNWFDENEIAALAGRCLLDTLEYLRTIPKFPGRFWQLANAHTMRLAYSCLSDKDFDKGKSFLGKIKPRIEDTYKRLLDARQNSAPHYGDDFWDWAAILEALVEVQGICSKTIIDDKAITRELDTFYENVEKKLSKGLTISSNEGEWYGPATAAIAYRVFRKFRNKFSGNVEKMLDPLRKQALELVEKGSYRGRLVEKRHVLWHYGQVVAEFPAQKTRQQATKITFLASVKSWTEKSDRVYALARVLQGAFKVGDNKTFVEGMSELYKCQTLGRPLGEGLMADTVKGSLNVLDALWPALKAREKTQIYSMIGTLFKAHNTVGVVVAVDREAEEAKKRFLGTGARVVRQDSDTTIIEQASYRVILCMGKGLIAATDVTRTLIDKHKARWLIMLGIAGSLGTRLKSKGKKPLFHGPDKGHVVIATSIAPFRIRDKVRTYIQNARVPLRGDTWMIIPTDPMLFCLAHEAGDELYKAESGKLHEGLIVTGTGIKDALKVKNEILREFPGGIAVEEEGYVVGLLCMVSGMPYLIIRGISDLAQGDKQKQKRDPQIEKAEQVKASRAAARVAVRVVELLSERW